MWSSEAVFLCCITAFISAAGFCPACLVCHSLLPAWPHFRPLIYSDDDSDNLPGIIFSHCKGVLASDSPANTRRRHNTEIEVGLTVAWSVHGLPLRRVVSFVYTLYFTLPSLRKMHLQRQPVKSNRYLRLGCERGYRFC
jgi:hypothetical protein